MNSNSTIHFSVPSHSLVSGGGRGPRTTWRGHPARSPDSKGAPISPPGATKRKFAPWWIQALVLLVLFAPSLASAKEQEAGKPAAPSPAAASPKDKELPTASRYVAPEDMQAYVTTMLNSLSITERAIDPFGQYQDPDAKPAIKPTVAKRTRRVAPLKATPFDEIVRLIRVNTVMPADKQFLIGTRTVKEGETLSLNFRGRSIKVTVARVSSRQIEFRNLESGETASITLNMLPAGMTMGSGGITPPGMVPEIPNAPIDLDPGDAFNSHP